jgi:hypothetical protein
MRDSDAKRRMLRIADDYEELATRTEKRLRDADKAPDRTRRRDLRLSFKDERAARAQMRSRERIWQVRGTFYVRGVLFPRH